jgi:hypothetical protein
MFGSHFPEQQRTVQFAAEAFEPGLDSPIIYSVILNPTKSFPTALKPVFPLRPVAYLRQSIGSQIGESAIISMLFSWVMKSRRIPVTSRLSLIPYGYLEGRIKDFTGNKLTEDFARMGRGLTSLCVAGC